MTEKIEIDRQEYDDLRAAVRVLARATITLGSERARASESSVDGLRASEILFLFDIEEDESSEEVAALKRIEASGAAAEPDAPGLFSTRPWSRS